MIRVRVAKVPGGMLNRLSSRKRSYYKKQAVKIAKILNHKIMQTLIDELIRRENINPNEIADIRVMVLPSIGDRGYGDHLFGLYDPEIGQISIYPAVKYRSHKFLTDPMVSFQFIRESFDTIIHEVLHLKYSNESTVEDYTKKYLELFYQMLRDYLE